MEKINVDMCRKVRQKKGALIVCAGCILCVYFFGGFFVCADDTMNVKRESEKTVYTIGACDEKNNVLDTHSDREKTVHSIGSNKTRNDEEAKDRERSWDMLKNIGIVIDGRQDKHNRSNDPQSYRKQSQKKSQQAQPIPAQ